MLTDEDHLIFRRLMPVDQQGRYHKQDRRDYMRLRRDLATRRPPWGLHADMMHSLRAWGDFRGASL